MDWAAADEDEPVRPLAGLCGLGVQQALGRPLLERRSSGRSDRRQGGCFLGGRACRPAGFWLTVRRAIRAKEGSGIQMEMLVSERKRVGTAPLVPARRKSLPAQFGAGRECWMCVDPEAHRTAPRLLHHTGRWPEQLLRCLHARCKEHVGPRPPKGICFRVGTDLGSRISRVLTTVGARGPPWRPSPRAAIGRSCSRTSRHRTGSGQSRLRTALPRA